MTIWYLKPETGGGSPTGAGTILDPWNGYTNIDWTETGIQPGDFFELGDYSYDEGVLNAGGSGTSGNPITIQNGVVDGGATAGCLASIAYDYISYLNIDGKNAEVTAAAIFKSGHSTATPVGIKYTNCTATGGGFLGFQTTSSSYFIDGCLTDDSFVTDCLQVNAGTGASGGTVQNSTFITKVGSAGDCVQIGSGSGDNYILKNTLTNQS